MCIMALTSAHSKHIPFRNSKLTLILKESLGGNSKTTLLCTASRQKRHNEESVQTLYFASRAKAIKNLCRSNVQLGVKELQYLVDGMKKEIMTLRGGLKKGGLNFNPIIDPKLLSIIRNNEYEIDGDEVIGDVVVDDNARGKRASLIHLSEHEIIIKYCELRAKFDNLLETAGSKIYQLSNQPKTEIDHDLISDIKNETDLKLQEIIEENKNQINLLNEELERNKKLLETKENEFSCKIQEASREKMIRDEECLDLGRELAALRESLKSAQNEIEELKQKLTKKKKKSEILKEELAKLKNEKIENLSIIETLSKKLSESESKNLDTKHKLDESNHINDLYQIELENLKSLLKQKEENEEFQKSKIKDLQDEILKNLEQISISEKKYSDLNNKFSEFELRIKTETETFSNKELYHQSLIEQLKNENEKLNKIIQEKISGQEIFAETEKILSFAKGTLEKRIEDLLAENEKIKIDQSDQLSKFNSEKSEFSSLIDSLNRELKCKSGELDNSQFELENVKKTFEEKLKSESQKVDQLNTRFENSEKRRNELEALTLTFTESENKLTQENSKLEKDSKEKSAALEEKKEQLAKHMSQNEKLEQEIKELREALTQSQNKSLQDSENEKKLLSEIALLKNDLEFQSKKIYDSERKVEEVKFEKKVLQEVNQKISSVI